MAKIIMCYSSGSMYENSDNLNCFNYASPEAFLCDFEQELNIAIELSEQFEDAREDFLKTLKRSYSSKEWEAFFKEYIKLNPNGTGDVFYFCGQSFSRSEFYQYNHETMEWSTVLPDVYSLEDWFAQNVINPIEDFKDSHKAK